MWFSRATLKVQGGFAMTAEYFWILFLRTGLPEAYLLYRLLLGA